MSIKPTDLQQPRLLDSAFVWDEVLADFVTAYRTDFRRQKTVTPVSAILFNSAALAYTSPVFQVAGYRDLLLLINLDVTLAPTDIRIDLQFSDDQANFHKYMIGPFGDLRYEDSAGDLKESLNAPILAPYMRIYVLSSGCDANNTFLLTLKTILTT